jgi:hypothetical protein
MICKLEMNEWGTQRFRKVIPCHRILDSRGCITSPDFHKDPSSDPGPSSEENPSHVPVCHSDLPNSE